MKTMKFSLEKQQVCCEICHAVLRGALKKVWKKETMFQRVTAFFHFICPTLWAQRRLLSQPEHRSTPATICNLGVSRA